MTLQEMIEQLRAWVRARAHALRLAGSYLSIIMVMSICFSAVFYHTSARELGRQLPPRVLRLANGLDDYHTFFQNRIAEGQSHLLHRLIFMNIAVLILGALLSYYLARRTLEPIETAMEAQARFASDASHELRTPLATIQTENEVALRNPKLTLPRAKELLRSNLEEVVRMRTLAEGLLRLARGSEGGLELGPVDLNEAAGNALATFKQALEQKHLAVERQTPAVKVRADAGSLTQIISILLDNAVKYSHEHSSVSITASQDGTNGYLAIKDQGVGISAEDMPHIFERFYRADPSRSKSQVDGNGLGLALAANLVRQLDGEITATSALGHGATFAVRLPLAS